MGGENSENVPRMTERKTPPDAGEIEVTVIGPGYGETVVLHLGDGSWIVVDSCRDDDGTPKSLVYLDEIGVDASRQVLLVVATHWHDDHIDGIAETVAVCSRAVFCCSGVLRKTEFLTAVAAFDENEPFITGSGMRELREVFDNLGATERVPVFALADRRILQTKETEVWALSPNDRRFRDFLRSIGQMIPDVTEATSRMPTPGANAMSVVLDVRAGDAEVLLGADLERSGWKAILNSRTRPELRAGVFKVPHHGSADADEPSVWKSILDFDAHAVLTPWTLAGRVLPTTTDVRRILSRTPHAWTSAPPGRSRRVRPQKAVDRTVREIGGKRIKDAVAGGMVRMRRPMKGDTGWRTETFGVACHLERCVA